MAARTVYLAGRYSRREELLGYAQQLEAAGFLVTSRWLQGAHQISKDGQPLGEAGEAAVEAGGPQAGDFALDDLHDVRRAALLVSFTEEPRRPSSNRGGRHVEFGIALAAGLDLAIVGPRENVFHWLPLVAVYPEFGELLAALVAEGSDSP